MISFGISFAWWGALSPVVLSFGSICPHWEEKSYPKLRAQPLYSTLLTSLRTTTESQTPWANAQWLSGDGGSDGSETFEFSVRISIFVLSIGRAGESGSGTLNSHFSVRISIFALSILWFFQAYRVDSSIHLFALHYKIIKKVVYEYHQTFQRIVIFSGCSKRCISAPCPLSPHCRTLTFTAPPHMNTVCSLPEIEKRSFEISCKTLGKSGTTNKA